jgi:hypothetical protein
MPALFPPWSDTILRVSLAVGFSSVVGGVFALMAWSRSPTATGEAELVVQPVKFDHRHHVRDDGIDCLYCHSDARKSPYAGIPATSVCMGCHGQIWSSSPELAAVRASAFNHAPIEWVRVNNLPDHVFFDHSIHVAKGVGCVTCHGRVDQMATVMQSQSLLMSFCVDCHKAPEKQLRPRDQVTNMEYAPTRPQEEIGRELVARYDVHPKTDCSGCHR